MTSAPAYFYPNRMGRIVLKAMNEILGKDGVDLVYQQSALGDELFARDTEQGFSFQQISRLQSGLEQAYGTRVGRGLALRVGKACLKFGLREFGTQLGLGETAFRLSPLRVKLKTGSRIFAGLFNDFTDQRVRLEEDDLNLYWHIDRCPLCWQRHADGACCHMAVGLLQESLYWISGGKYFDVSERSCIACGDSACTIVINQTPMS